MDGVIGIPLHQVKNLTNECAAVLNEEWPRSLAARCHMLEKSSDDLPYSLIMFDTRSNTVIGHSRLCSVQGIPDACLVESIVVLKAKRGKGYGKELVYMTDQHAKKIGFNIIYLTTHDKQMFYARCGYSLCEPIVTLGSGSKLLSQEQFRKMFGHQSVESSEQSECTGMKQESNAPPPPPLPNQSQSLIIQRVSETFWMKKNLL